MEFLKGLPVRLEEWLRKDRDPVRLLVGFVKSVILVIIGMVINGIVEGTSFAVWESSVAPWLSTERFSATNGLLATFGLTCCSGWSLALVAAVASMLIYGADRRRLGQLEEVGSESVERANRIEELDRELGRLRDCLEQSRLADRELLELLAAMDRELLLLLTSREPNPDPFVPFLDSVCRRLFQVIGSAHAFRASVYLVDAADCNYLTIFWDYGVGEVSRRVNRWYIGSEDPTVRQVRRGIPGEVYVRGEGRVNSDVRADPDFYDAYVPKRSALPYRSTLHAVIHPNSLEYKQGVLCLDSLTYEFTDDDLSIARQVAIRIGWLFYTLRNITKEAIR